MKMPAATALLLAFLPASQLRAQTFEGEKPAEYLTLGNFHLNASDAADDQVTFADISAQPDCAQNDGADDDGEIVVCAAANPGDYRLNADLLRAQQKPANNFTMQSDMVKAKCEPTRAMPCSTAVVPVTSIAITLVKAGVEAASGGEWRDAFQSMNDDEAEFKAYLKGK